MSPKVLIKVDFKNAPKPISEELRPSLVDALCLI